MFTESLRLLQFVLNKLEQWIEQEHKTSLPVDLLVKSVFRTGNY